MERITISVDEALAKEFDALIKKRGYASRSEAMRDPLRREVEANRVADEAKSYCVANLSYVYNHHERDLAERPCRRAPPSRAGRRDQARASRSRALPRIRHPQGADGAVRAFAGEIQAERGVRHGRSISSPSRPATRIPAGALTSTTAICT